MKTARSPANPAWDTDSTPAIARNWPLPGAALSAPSGHSGGEECNSGKLLRSENTHARANTRAHTRLTLSCSLRSGDSPLRWPTGTGLPDREAKMTGPAGAILRPRRASGRVDSVHLAATNHRTAWTWEQFLFPPHPPPANSPARVFQLDATTLQGTGAFREWKVRAPTSHPESTRFPSGRGN